MLKKTFLFTAILLFTFQYIQAQDIHKFKIGHIDITDGEVENLTANSQIPKGIHTKIIIDEKDVFYIGGTNKAPLTLNSNLEKIDNTSSFDEGQPIGDENKLKSILKDIGKDFNSISSARFIDLIKENKKCDTCKWNRNCNFKGCRCKCNWESTSERRKGKCCNNEYGEKCDRSGEKPVPCP